MIDDELRRSTSGRRVALLVDEPFPPDEPDSQQSPTTPKPVLSHTLDHTEYALDTSDITCEPGQMWLCVFCLSGIALPMLFELLHLHAGPAAETTFLMPFFGYCGQLVVGGAWVLAHGTWHWREGRWDRRMVCYLLLSSIANGAAQALDFVAVTQAGISLYVIFHASVTFFACLIAYFVLRTRITPVQWFGCGAVVVGLVLTGVPSTSSASKNFSTGLIAAICGSSCLAASYPLTELVFRRARGRPPSEEFCSFAGSLINVLSFGTWSLAYTLPRWQQMVLDPIARSAYPSPGPAVGAMYAAHALMVGVHTLAFWKTMRSLGTVPTAMSKGAQQAGTFLLAHVLYCGVDAKQCMDDNHGAAHPTTWSKVQKPVSFVLCCIGCVVYAIVKKRPREPRPREVDAGHIQQQD